MRVQKKIDWKNFFYFLIKVVLILGVIANFWIFSRFTVDDAFITWRYGKNLVLHGIWNYNPSSYDMTQAYTNPIYAFLSIIPAYFRIDTVLFFKVFSLVIICLFAFYYTRKTKQGAIILLVAFALPGTMIHAFSGLETFLFIALLTVLLISIYEESWYETIITTGFLFYTRPESLVLLLVIPLLYCDWQSIGYKNIFSADNYKPRLLLSFIKNFITAKSIRIFLILLIMLLPNLIISYLNFHSILPNTFYVKDSSFVTIQFFLNAIKYGLTLLPLVMAYRYITIKKNIPILLFFLCMVIQYSKTNFSMDYNIRSVYHLLFPIALFIFYVINNNKNCLDTLTITFHGLKTNKSFSLCKVSVFLILFLFFSRGTSFDVSGLAHMASYYYRCLSAHAAAGKIINNVKEKYAIHSIACGDAGMLAFHADVDSLDLLELGSAVLTHNGINEAYPLYKPDVLFLHGSEEGVRNGIFEDAKNMSQYEDKGKVTWLKNYFLWVYSDKNMPELSAILEESYKANYKGNSQVFKEHMFSPPWSQWHE
jgi:hypothetical protein